MEKNLLVIKIDNNEYQIDEGMEYFHPFGKQEDNKNCLIPLNRFRYREEAWYILWDKKTHSYFDITVLTPNLPLTVEWIKVIFEKQQIDQRERIGLLILLSEAASLLRSSAEGELKKPELGLKKNVSQFLTRNDG